MAIGSRIGDRPGVRPRSGDEGYRRWTWRSPPARSWRQRRDDSGSGGVHASVGEQASQVIASR